MHKHSPCFLSQLETFLENEPKEQEALTQVLETSYQLESQINRLKVQEVINSQNPKKSSHHFLEISGLCNNYDTALRKDDANIIIIIIISVINGNRILKFEKNPMYFQ
jgi:hypothetical protein